MGLSHSGWTAELRCATSGAVLSLAAGAQMDCDWLALADMASPAGGSRRPGWLTRHPRSRVTLHVHMYRTLKLLLYRTRV
eukprot:9089069-Pyramimonas_sp.AAC.1